MKTNTRTARDMVKAPYFLERVRQRKDDRKEMMDSAEEPRQVLQVKQYLVAPFPPRRARMLMAPVAQAYEQFDDNHFRDSVPLLVERRANTP